MRIAVTTRDLSRQKVDLAACFAYEGDAEPRGVEDPQLRRELAHEMKAERFKGRAGDRVVWNAQNRYASHRFVILGLGRPRPIPGEAIRVGCARAAREAAKFSARSLALRLPEVDDDQRRDEARAAVEGALLGAYQFQRYLTDPDRRKTELERVELSSPGGARGLRAAVERGQIAGLAVRLARDLVNEAPSRKAPAELARRMAREAKAAGLGCKVLGPAELNRVGLRALLAVGRGSSRPPRVVHLTYRPRGGRARQKVVLVGKGVTFDSGGLNLKPGPSMLTMKSDMAGAAAVMATMTTLEPIGCRAEVHALLGLVENMLGAEAYKPGDILETFAGKTVEVGNTDAEGRLVLCDLMAYAAKRLRPTRVVDVATLTGACVVALGTLATGVFSRHDELADELLEAGRVAGEKLWPMPMYEEYLELLQKGPADLCNVGGRWGGAITAALFLGEFLPRELPWAHLDIAGPAFAESPVPESPAGGTGAGVRTLMRWLETI